MPILLQLFELRLVYEPVDSLTCSLSCPSIPNISVPDPVPWQMLIFIIAVWRLYIRIIAVVDQWIWYNLSYVHVLKMITDSWPGCSSLKQIQYKYAEGRKRKEEPVTQNHNPQGNT